MTLDIAWKVNQINNNAKIELSFDDTLFLQKRNWYKDIDYTTKYPNLIYIFNKYYSQ